MIFKFISDFIFKQIVQAHLFAQLNGFKYSYQTLIILFNIYHSFVHS